jgi:acetolactate synthase small subunit
VAENFSGKVIDAEDSKAVILEFVAEHEQTKSILNLLEDFGILEVVSTGNIAMQRGKNVL